MDVVTLGAALSIMKKMPDTAASSAAAAEDAADRAEAAAEQAEGAITVDDTLSVKGQPADAKKTGDAIDDLSEALDTEEARAKSEEERIEALFTQPVEEAVSNWLDGHPEATTTVQDASLTYAKLVTGTLGYVIPEMFGAVGDGITDDTTAIIQAANSGFGCNLGGNAYVVTQVITFSNGMFYNGTLKLIGAARIVCSNFKFYNVTFDMTGKTEASQIALKFTGGSNIVKNCIFSDMVARLFAYQIDSSSCELHVDGCTFGIVRVLEINDIQGNNTGSARHIAANTCDITIENCSFNGFYGVDENFFEDSDCVHVTRCEHAVISKNLFTGYWKSAIKNQYANVIVTDNTFSPRKAWYVIRSHTEAKNALITGNIISGACDICFYFTSGKNNVCHNNIDMSANQLLLVANAEVIFNDNQVSIESNAGLHRIYNEDEIVVFLTGTGTSVKIESNSDVVCDNHFHYRFGRETTQSTVKLTGKIITSNTKTSVLYDLTGEIRIGQTCTFQNASDLIVYANDGKKANFHTCNNIKYYPNEQVSSSNIINCNDIYVKANYKGTTYFADITNSQNVVIELFGTSIDSNIVAVNDVDTTGIIVNYINNNANIYNRNRVELAYVAKSIYA